MNSFISRCNYIILLANRRFALEMAECGSLSKVELDKWKHGPPKDYVLKQYKWIKQIGSGGFGDVIEVLQLSSNTFMAMKLLRRDPTKGAQEDFSKEMNNINKAGPHANIAICHDYAIYSDTHNAIFMEVFNTDLWSFIKISYNRDDIPLMIDISLQTISGLAYLHSRKPPMIHRDIKPPNVLIKRHPKTNAVIAKLSDFGISNIIESGGVSESPTMSDLVNRHQRMITTVGGRGTILFLASEFFAAKDGRGLIDGRFRIGSSVDIFAMGLVYLYMFCYNNSDYGK